MGKNCHELGKKCHKLGKNCHKVGKNCHEVGKSKKSINSRKPPLARAASVFDTKKNHSNIFNNINTFNIINNNNDVICMVVKSYHHPHNLYFLIYCYIKITRIYIRRWKEKRLDNKS